MASTVDDPQMPEEVAVEPLDRALGSRYLQYALSTIMHRALPDARDGLKPVQRRILFAMRELGLTARGGFRKSAKIAGDVMGNYHPHGDAAIYDAMARLAQDFVVRYPLVDGQGNFGNIDGDGPAAARYTEARLTAAAEALMEGLDEDAVDYGPNYDGTAEEPLVLPASFPNLLANGSSGIAVGMATNIPPHNLDELCAACLHLLKAPNARDETLFELVPGPDFPTGGVIVEPPERSPRPIAPAAAASGCGPAGRSRSCRGACGRSWSPKSPGRCRNRSWSPPLPRWSRRRRCRSWPTSATKAPKTCG
jgi:topoisomerase-4 subunit A